MYIFERKYGSETKYNQLTSIYLAYPRVLLKGICLSLIDSWITARESQSTTFAVRKDESGRWNSISLIRWTSARLWVSYLEAITWINELEVEVRRDQQKISCSVGRNVPTQSRHVSHPQSKNRQQLNIKLLNVIQETMIYIGFINCHWFDWFISVIIVMYDLNLKFNISS